MTGDVRFADVQAGAVRLHVAQAGPADGPLVILLHGFPEFWYGWHRQIPALANAGFCVWAPDQRGYNLSDKPERVRDYRLDLLAADVSGLIAAAGRRRAVVAGHDWGGAVAWWLAADRPELVERLIILNVPHPLVLRQMLRTNLRQLLRSWYMFLFQLPWLPEAMARRGNWQGMANGMVASSRPGTFDEADFEAYRRAWSQPRAMTTMIHWYRAMFRYGAPPPRNCRILSPTLLLWGEQDQFIGREGAERSLALCDNATAVFFAEATHWVQHEEPAEINRHMVAFVNAGSREFPAGR